MEIPLPNDPRMRPLTADSTPADLKKAARDQLKVYAKINEKCAKKAAAELSRRTKEKTGEMYRIMNEEGEMTDDLRNAYALKAIISM